MDIKDLNKPQMILLTLLVSFVVSIATGITAVSLMQQVPQAVPQTINRVIQRTIEQVTTEVPIPAENQPIGVTSEELNVDIYSGAVLDKAFSQGVIISDAGLILSESTRYSLSGTYSVMLEGKLYPLAIVRRFDNGFILFKIGNPTTTPVGAPASENPVVLENQ